MAIAYRVVPHSDSTYAVVVTPPGGQALEGASGFRSEAEAQAWIAEKKRLWALQRARDDKERPGEAQPAKLRRGPAR